MKKNLLFGFCFFLTAKVFCFDWPISSVNKDSFKSYFGQLRGNKISTSLVFNTPSEVKASDDGRVLLVITNSDNDETDFFPSTLGNSIIISHEDNLLSVYGNLEKKSIVLNDESEIFVEKGSTIATTGNSAWQNEQSTLEFQIIDTKNSSAINPKILMSRLETENPYKLSDISLVNKNGDEFSINTKKTYASGIYKIYQKKNEIITPSQTSVLFNGIIVDVISYDTINQENKRIYVSGSKKKYVSEDVYPTQDRFLLGEIMLSPGKITLGLTAIDALGKLNVLNYNISVY